MVVKEQYEELFEPERGVMIDELPGFSSYYPNRSISYIDTYKLHDAATFICTNYVTPILYMAE